MFSEYNGVGESGASTLQNTTTVQTGYRGRTSFTARANGVTGSYAIGASAPGVEQSRSLDLTNSPAAVPDAAKPVPTMSQWALALLTLILGGFAAMRFRRSRMN